MGLFDKLKGMAKDLMDEVDNQLTDTSSTEQDDSSDDSYDETPKNEIYRGCKPVDIVDNDVENLEKAWKTANLRMQEALRDAIDKGSIKVNPDDESEVEVRGRINDRPLRIKWSSSDEEPDDPEIEAQCSGAVPTIDLERDYDQIPKTKDTDEDWGEEDQEIRVFVAKGIFAEGDEEEVSETLNNFKALPQELADRILETMETCPLRFFRAGYNRLEATYDINFPQMLDPVADVIQVAELLDEVARLYDSGEVKAATPGAQSVDYKRVTCGYCTTQFVLGTDSNCPNCGAPYSE